MGYRFPLSICVIAAITLSGSIAAGASQRRVGGQAEAAKQAIQASLAIGGQTYQSSEPGKCTHAPTASIYGIVSEMWSVQQSGAGGSLSLSFWKPKDGSGDMVTVSVNTGNTSHEINTVRGAATSGSGSASLAKAGGGGTFTLTAKTKNGTAITGTIKCEAFAPHTAEGGL